MVVCLLSWLHSSNKGSVSTQWLFLFLRQFYVLPQCAYHTCYLTKSQCADTGPTSSSLDLRRLDNVVTGLPVFSITSNGVTQPGVDPTTEADVLPLDHESETKVKCVKQRLGIKWFCISDFGCRCWSGAPPLDWLPAKAEGARSTHRWFRMHWPLTSFSPPAEAVCRGVASYP